MNYQTQLVLACFYTSTNSTTARKADPGSLVSDNVGHPIFFSNDMFMTFHLSVAGSCPLYKHFRKRSKPPLRWYRISPDETNIGESRVWRLGFFRTTFFHQFFRFALKNTFFPRQDFFHPEDPVLEPAWAWQKLNTPTAGGGAWGCHRCNVYIHTVDGSEIWRSPVEFFVTFFGMVKWPFQGLSDRQLGDQKVTLNHLVYILLFTGFILFRRLPSWGRSHIPSQPALLKMMIFGLSRLVGYAFSYWRVHISLFEDWVRVGWGVDPPPAVFLGNPTEIWSFTHHESLFSSSNCTNYFLDSLFRSIIAELMNHGATSLVRTERQVFWIVCESTFYSDMPNWIDWTPVTSNVEIFGFAMFAKMLIAR